MIRAATGHPVTDTGGVKQAKSIIVRPSSASAKLQSYAYANLRDERRPLTAASNARGKQDKPKTVYEDAGKPPPQFCSDRRLTLSIVDGIGENAKALTRLNTPAGSTTKIKIEERITLEQLHKIKTAFEEADTDGSGTLDIDEFKVVVRKCLGVRGRNEEQINALFMKIDSSSDGEIDWDEFCTYMQLEYSEKEEAMLRSKRVQFALPAHTISTPHHKAQILRVIHITDSSYLCASQDGLFTFWSSDLKLKRTRSIIDSMSPEKQSFQAKPTVWVTDVAMMWEHGKLLVGTGERELHFYEVINFELSCQMIGLDAVPLRIDVSYGDDERCLVVFGDDQGCVSILIFTSIGDTLRSWKSKALKVNGVPTVTVQDVALGAGTTFVKWKVHDDWITEIRYFHQLRSVISSSNDDATALVRGCTTASTALDQMRNQLPVGGSGAGTSPSPVAPSRRHRHPNLLPQRRQKTDQSVFRVYKGVKSFDLCTVNNVLATGGLDRIVRLWNPYVPQKPTGLLRGHNSPIVHIAISSDDHRIFSISADKCIKVWDLLEQNCLVTVNSKLHKIRGEITSCSYSDRAQAIAIATDHLSLLRISQKDVETLPPAIAARMKQTKLLEETSMSHSEAVTCCAYNSNFNHVVTCSEGSVVKLWDFETGNFMFEFTQAHGDAAITSLTFDWSGRRLITSGRDGSVRMWNYNNGHCLRSLERENDTREVSDCCYFELNNNRYVAAVGWDRRINIFDDEPASFHLVQRPLPNWPDDLRNGHAEDVVVVAFGAPNLLATASYTGFIIVWNIISGHNIARIPFPDSCTSDEDDSSDEYDSDDSTRDMLTDGVRDIRRGVNRLAFIHARVPDKESAALLAGCADGTAILWNFNSCRAHARWRATRDGAAMSAMQLAYDDRELFAGDHLGYVTVWDMDEHGVHPPLDVGDDPDQPCPGATPAPPLIHRWRCHVQPVTWLVVIESHDMVLTSSTDYTVRLWTTDGRFVGTFGQSQQWDLHDVSTWKHPMVPPEVLIDPNSMPLHPIMNEKSSVMEVVHMESLEPSDSEDENQASGDDAENEKPGARERRASVCWKGGGGGGGGGGSTSGAAWMKRLQRRLSRPSLGMMEQDGGGIDERILDEVRQSMCKSAGKRLRHEKLVAQQHALRSGFGGGGGVDSHAFQALKYFDLASPPGQVTKPNPRDHIDDVFDVRVDDCDNDDDDNNNS